MLAGLRWATARASALGARCGLLIVARLPALPGLALENSAFDCTCLGMGCGR